MEDLMRCFLLLVMTSIVGCVANGDDGYDPLPPGGGGGSGSGPDAGPTDPDKPAPLAPSYSVAWTPGPLEDSNGELHMLMCTPALCAPITSTTTVTATLDGDQHLDMVFSSPGSQTHVVSATKFAKDATGWFVVVAARTDAVGMRKEFSIRQNASAALTGTIRWDVGSPASHVRFDFVATPTE